ncbi:MAG TPA: SDR family NAD(P)-dependent oxidoreductase, partial [Bacteroidota bacterium]|nr:SDR family NAD(P)-dependent oxidoreductase [Bacteroidota bacterium]
MLNGKVAIVTGASSGIGAALALQLSREGAAVILGARRRENLERLAREINAGGQTAVPVPADVTRPRDAERLVR